MHQGPFLLLPPSWNLSEQSYWTLSRLKPEDEIQAIKKLFLELGMPFMLSSKYYFKNTSRRQWTNKELFLVSSGTWKLQPWISNQGTLPWCYLHSWSLWNNLIEHHRRQEPRTRFIQPRTSSTTPRSKDLHPRPSWNPIAIRPSSPHEALFKPFRLTRIPRTPSLIQWTLHMDCIRTKEHFYGAIQDLHNQNQDKEPKNISMVI